MKILSQEAKFIVTLEFNSPQEFKSFSAIVKKVAEGEGSTEAVSTKRAYKRNRAINNKGWTSEEIEYIKQNHETESPKMLSEKLGRTPGAIYQLKVRIGLTGKPVQEAKYKRSTDEEVNYIRENYGVISLAKIAANLKRSDSYVYNITKKFAMKRNTATKPASIIAEGTSFLKAPVPVYNPEPQPTESATDTDPFANLL